MRMLLASDRELLMSVRLHNLMRFRGGTLFVRCARIGMAVALAALQTTTLYATAADSHSSAKPPQAPPPSPDPLGLQPLSPTVAPVEKPVMAPLQKPTAITTKKTAAPSKTSSTSTKAAATPTKTSTTVPPVAPSIEKYPKVGELETLMFGVAHSNIPLEYRLDRLESEVYHQTNPHWLPEQRIDRLSQTLIGGNGGAARPPAPQQQQPYTPDLNNYIPPAVPNSQQAPSGGLPPYSAPVAQDGFVQPPVDLNTPDMQHEMSREQAEQYAIDAINETRERQGLPILVWDDVAAKVGHELTDDLSKRNTLSHQNAAGENPDLRYTKAGGADCMVESVTSVKAASKLYNKAIVQQVISDLMSHQDDRDALLGAHATQAAFAITFAPSGDKAIAATEVVTKQADMTPIPSEAAVGDKVQIKGVIKGPYKFAKITVAWEGILPTNGEDVAEEQDEALPYFPPLDYQAFSKRAEHDYQKAIRLLQIAGMGAAIAGGIFMPPVALAAPLIAAAGSTAKPKAVSDIPVKGGVKVDGAMFEDKIPLSKDNKEGIYYITVWATSDAESAPFAISRRAVVAKSGGAEKADTAETTTQSRLVSVSNKKDDKKQEKDDHN